MDLGFTLTQRECLNLFIAVSYRTYKTLALFLLLLVSAGRLTFSHSSPVNVTGHIRFRSLGISGSSQPIKAC